MIEVNCLSKRYGTLVAVDDLSFRVGPGEVLGFLGPNGAGKSTTMRIIAGFVAPSAGLVAVCGHDVVSAPLAARRALGYLPEGAPAWPEMTPRSFLAFIADVRGLARDSRRRRLTDTIDRLELGTVLDQRIETLSKGYRRRVGLAQAILHDPPVLVLDEPTDGLDPNQKHEVRALIREMSTQKTILISTHLLEEVQALCSRALIVAHGRLLANDRPAALEARSRYHGAVCVTLAEPTEPSALARLESALAALPGVARVEAEPRLGQLTALPLPGHQLLEAVSACATHLRIPLQAIAIERGRLDEVFRALTHVPPRRS